MEGWSTELIKQSPYLAAVIIVVGLFLRYLQTREEDWRTFLKYLSDQQNQVVGRLADRMDDFSNLLSAHDARSEQNFANVREVLARIEQQKSTDEK